MTGERDWGKGLKRDRRKRVGIETRGREWGTRQEQVTGERNRDT